MRYNIVYRSILSTLLISLFYSIVSAGQPVIPKTQEASPAVKTQVTQNLSAMPLYFIENQGQVDSTIRDYCRDTVDRSSLLPEKLSTHSYSKCPKHLFSLRSFSLTLNWTCQKVPENSELCKLFGTTVKENIYKLLIRLGER